MPLDRTEQIDARRQHTLDRIGDPRQRQRIMEIQQGIIGRPGWAGQLAEKMLLLTGHAPAILLIDQKPLVDEHADQLFNKERIALSPGKDRMTESFGQLGVLQQGAYQLLALLGRKGLQHNSSK